MTSENYYLILSRNNLISGEDIVQNQFPDSQMDKESSVVLYFFAGENFKYTYSIGVQRLPGNLIISYEKVFCE